jgi:hypothetical protein
MNGYTNSGNRNAVDHKRRSGYEQIGLTCESMRDFASRDSPSRWTTVFIRGEHTFLKSDGSHDYSPDRHRKLFDKRYIVVNWGELRTNLAHLPFTKLSYLSRLSSYIRDQFPVAIRRTRRISHRQSLDLLRIAA